MTYARLKSIYSANFSRPNELEGAEFQRFAPKKTVGSTCVTRDMMEMTEDGIRQFFQWNTNKFVHVSCGIQLEYVMILKEIFPNF